MNPNVRMRGQLRYPTGRELRWAMADMAQRSGATFGLTADVSEAHRRFMHLERDHGLLGCVLEDEPTRVLINMAGPLGMGSAPYWWAREFASLARCPVAVLMNHPGTHSHGCTLRRHFPS